jgi:plastocyanin
MPYNPAVVAKRREAGRRVLTVAILAIAGVFLATGISLAVNDQITAVDNSFTGSPYSTDQGLTVPFKNNGLSSHNVTATAAGPDGKPLFRSATISGGGAGTVDGTQYLPTGDYAFFCTIHGSIMSGTLHVTGAGSAVARPQISLAVTSRKLAKVVKKGKLQVNVGALTRSDNISVEAKLGKTTLGRATVVSLAAGAKQTVAVKLNKSAKRKLAQKSKATVLVNAAVPFGSPASTKAKLK